MVVAESQEEEILLDNFGLECSRERSVNVAVVLILRKTWAIRLAKYPLRP